jgi:hypothetical protein
VELRMNILQLILKKFIEAILKKNFNLQPNQWPKISHLACIGCGGISQQEIMSPTTRPSLVTKAPK